MHLVILPSNTLPGSDSLLIWKLQSRRGISVFSILRWISPSMLLATLPLHLCKLTASITFEGRKLSPYIFYFSLHLQCDWTGCCIERKEHVLLLVTNQYYISECQGILNPNSHLHFSENHWFAVHFVIPEVTVFCGLTFQGLVLCLVNFVYSLILHEFSSAFLQEVYVMSARIPV